MKARSRFIVLGTFSLLLFSCASYTDKSKAVRASLSAGLYDDALEKIEKSDLAKTDRDKVLYHMEKGMILYTAGRYASAVKDWAKASDRIEQLYTISISRQASSFAMNDSYADYEGELHEKILLPLMSALAYFANQEPDKAIVEIRRTYELLKVINAEGNSKNTFSRDAFSHYLSGLIYESKHEWDSAIVEYRNALEIGASNKKWMETLSLRPIVESLGRLAEFRGRQDVLSNLKKSHPDVSWTKHQSLMEKGEVYVVYEAGKSPLKTPKDFVVPTGDTAVRISFPVFKESYYSSRGAEVFLDDKPMGRTVLVQDVGQLAQQALNDRRFRDIVKLAARVIVKDQAARAAGRALGPLAQIATNVAGVVTETADTRSWTSLPDSIQILRVPVPAHQEVRIRIRPDSGNPVEFKIRARPGEKKLIRARTFD